MNDKRGIARRKRLFGRLLKEFHDNAGKKGNPTVAENEKVLRDIKEIRRDLWKKYKRRMRRDAAERKTGVIRCAAEGCKEEVCYVWVDAYLPDNRAVLIRREFMCYALCIKHDTILHEAIDKMRAVPSDLVRERVKIRG